MAYRKNCMTPADQCPRAIATAKGKNTVYIGKIPYNTAQACDFCPKFQTKTVPIEEQETILKIKNKDLTTILCALKDRYKEGKKMAAECLIQAEAYDAIGEKSDSRALAAYFEGLAQEANDLHRQLIGCEVEE